MPNVRRLFIPDPGMIIADVDLDRADLQVVVWEADDADLKRQLKMGVDLHIMNGVQLEGNETPPEEELVESHPEYPEHYARYSKQRQFAKSFIHGTNYGGKARTMGITAGISTQRAEYLQKRWFQIHPGIKAWHDRTMESLLRKREVRNAFGFRRFYFDRIDGILPEALAWVPQSTVAIIINEGLKKIDRAVIKEEMYPVELLLQVHDSLVFQYEKRYDPVIRPQIRNNLLITVPYEDPLVIPVGMQISDRSWGEVKSVKWTEEPQLEAVS